MRIVIFPALLALAASPVLADPGRGERQGAMREKVREEVERKIQTFLAVELSSRIGLDDKKSLLLAEAIKTHMERKHKTREQMHEELQKLEDLVEAKAADDKLRAQVKAVVQGRSREEDIEALLVDTSKFLSGMEQAKLVLSLPDAMKEIRRIVKDARDERRRDKPGRGGFGGRPDDDDE